MLVVMPYLNTILSPILVVLLAFLCLRPPSLKAQSVVLNEVVSSNSRGLLDESGNTVDWIELFNPGAQEISLAGYGLSDDPAAPFKCVITNATLRPKSFLVVYADSQNRQAASFPPLAPDQIPGLFGWFKASEVATNDAASVRKSGTLMYMRRWNDWRNNGVALSQAAGGLQPLFTPASANGVVPALLRFDGVDDALVLPASPATNNFTLVMVARSRAPHEVDQVSIAGAGGTSGQRYFFGADHGGNVNSGMGISLGTNGLSVYEHGDSYMPTLAVLTAPFASAMQVLGVRYLDKTPDIYWQGLAASHGLRSPRALVTAPTSLGAGAYGAWNGDLAELLIFTRALSEAEMVGLQRFLVLGYHLPERQSIHASFSLNARGETVLLTRPDGSLADEIAYPGNLPSDVSYGRQPDGGGPWFYFQNPTPGASNLTAAAVELLESPRFSHPSGAYSNSFFLTLSVSNSGASIRYTLDGSEPTDKSPQYTAPLSITNRASLPNILSLIPTVPGGIAPPTGLVNKLTAIRARAFKPGGLSAPSITRSFLVNPKGASRYTLPVVSLVSDRANFFDDTLGIYVPGNAAGGNYAQAGDAWERPGHVDFIETNGVAAFSQETGIRIHGNTSFYAPIKGLRLHPLNYPGTGPFQYQIFPDLGVRSFNRVILRPSGQDYNLTLFRDVFMQSLGADLGLDVQASRSAVVFIDGEYWGVHHIQEAFEEGYFKSHYPQQVDAAGVDYLEGYVSGVEGDTARWDAMMSFVQSHNIADPQSFASLRDYMDPENYADFKICEIFYYRWDIGNHRPWRPHTAQGRFRWILFDCDVGWGGFWAVPPAAAFRMLDYDLEPNGPWTQYEANPGGNDHNAPITTYLLRTLLINPTYRQYFINRFADVMNTTLHSNSATARIDSFAQRLAPEMKDHTDRWHAPGSMTEWSNNVSFLRQFAAQRPGFMRQQIQGKFGLAGTVTARLRVTDTNAGVIHWSTLDIAAPTNAPWTGVYFKGHPIAATAVANAGYRFVGWVEQPQAPQTLELNPAGDVSLTAQFVADPTTATLDPKPWPLGAQPYVWDHWDLSSPAGSYPPSMAFQQSSTLDPTLADGFTNRWKLAYNLASRSRLIGLGDEGLGFINTSEAQTDGGGYVGAAVLALNTLGVNQAQVQFTAGTVLTNTRECAISLQYRAGNSGAFANLVDGAGKPVSYQRNRTDGHSAVLGPVALPGILLNRPYVQLRWVYHYISGNSGPRAELRLDDILVAPLIPTPPPRFSSITSIPGGGARFEITGQPFQRYLLQASEDLASWVFVSRWTCSGDGKLRADVPLLPRSAHQFYRLVLDAQQGPIDPKASGSPPVHGARQSCGV